MTADPLDRVAALPEQILPLLDGLTKRDAIGVLILLAVLIWHPEATVAELTSSATRMVHALLNPEPVH